MANMPNSEAIWLHQKPVWLKIYCAHDISANGTKNDLPKIVLPNCPSIPTGIIKFTHGKQVPGGLLPEELVKLERFLGLFIEQLRSSLPGLHDGLFVVQCYRDPHTVRIQCIHSRPRKDVDIGKHASTSRSPL